eukprot:COSAG02_NODE_1928_length_10338_cov_85.895888_8_plen_74_part_00
MAAGGGAEDPRPEGCSALYPESAQRLLLRAAGAHEVPRMRLTQMHGSTRIYCVHCMIQNSGIVTELHYDCNLR